LCLQPKQLLLLLPLLLLELPQQELVVLLLHRLVLSRPLQLQHLCCHHRASRPSGHGCHLPTLHRASCGHRPARRGNCRHRLLLLQQLQQVCLRRPLLLCLLLQLLRLDCCRQLLVLLLQLLLVMPSSPGRGLRQSRRGPCTASHGCGHRLQ
jgi:hypothetical protein